MRFIKKWSYSCARGLSTKLKENNERKRLYYFGFQVAIGSFVKGGLLLLVAYLIKVMTPIICIMMVFSTLRVLAGGYHMDTYGKCFSMTLFLFLPFALIAKYSYASFGFFQLLLFIIVTFLIGFYILYKYAPKDTPNRPITKSEEIKKFRRMSIIYLVIWLILELVLVMFNLSLIAVSGCFGLLLEVVMITPSAYRVFDQISNLIDDHKC